MSRDPVDRGSDAKVALQDKWSVIPEGISQLDKVRHLISMGARVLHVRMRHFVGLWDFLKP